jgi:hypothetical protein
MIQDNLPTSAYGVIRLLPDSKQEVETFARQLIRSVESGEVSALQIAATLKMIDKVSEKFNEATKESQLREANLYPEKKISMFGFEIEKAEVGTRYDYSTCGDPIYNQRLQIFQEAQKQLKEREEFLKGVKESLTLVDEESGETARVRPPLKKSNEGLKFSLK